jgi:hypothetical protein
MKRLSSVDLQKIVDAIQLGIAYAPQAIVLVEKAKAYIEELFRQDLIAAVHQNQINDHLDAVTEAFANGARPPQFTVEPVETEPTPPQPPAAA